MKWRMEFDKPVNREPVVNLVLQRIKDAIIAGELKPGDKLPTELELSKGLGVGRTSVREAIKMLSGLGVIEVRRGDGTYIADSLNARTINPLIFTLAFQSGTSMELVELRTIVEVGFTKLAMEKMSEQDIEELSAIVDKHEQAVASGDKALFDQLELEFHNCILEKTDNPFVKELGRSVLEIFGASIRKTSKTIPSRAIEDHRRILAAIAQRDPIAVEKAVVKSFEIWRHNIKSSQ